MSKLRSNGNEPLLHPRAHPHPQPPPSYAATAQSPQPICLQPGGLLHTALVGADKFLVKQCDEPLEAFLRSFSIPYEEANKYNIYTSNKGLRFKALEESNACGRFCCAPHHALKLHVYDANSNDEVMIIERPFKLGGCCCVCFDICREEITIYEAAPSYRSEPHVIGKVTQPCCGGCLYPTLQILSRESNIDAVVTGPCCCIGGCCDVLFKVTDSTYAESYGEIKKEGPESLRAFANELVTDADNYSLSFPVNAKVETKATMIAALLLIDYMFFEDQGQAQCQPCACRFDVKCCDLYCCGMKLPCKLRLNAKRLKQ